MTCSGGSYDGAALDQVEELIRGRYQPSTGKDDTHLLIRNDFTGAMGASRVYLTDVLVKASLSDEMSRLSSLTEPVPEQSLPGIPEPPPLAC